MFDIAMWQSREGNVDIWGNLVVNVEKQRWKDCDTGLLQGGFV